MADRLVIDLDDDGQASLSRSRERDRPRLIVGPFPFEWPLTEGDLEDLRWYLEDYLRAPFGAYAERGPEIEASLTAWGHAIFEAVFGEARAREAYETLREESSSAEIVIRSPSAEVLGLPWELMQHPDEDEPVALHIGLSRFLQGREVAPLAADGDHLRVLMVIARPAGIDDVGYQHVARPLLDRLDSVRGRVEFQVLRPPTLEALASTLRTARATGKPFHIVHFDGHGVPDAALVDAGSGTVAEDAGNSDAEHKLVFEDPDGTRALVPVSSFARVVSEGDVPLVVLNSCRSGAVKDLEISLSARLLTHGVSSVVSMAYDVFADAAADFTSAFYERLFAGDTVTESVVAGRRRLADHRLRPSPAGARPLADWIVPVHYLRREARFPHLLADPTEVDGPSQRTDLAEVIDPLAPTDRFVGRDALVYEMEIEARRNRIIVLHGPGGTGKTELAKAFGRWWRDTGGVRDPRLIVFHSFEPGVATFGVESVITAIGLQAFGPDFARLERDARREVVVSLLTSERFLLIWDNFESVTAMPDPAGVTPVLGEEEWAAMQAFLRDATDGDSVVVITSRSPEPSLGPEVSRLAVGGLEHHEAVDYADQVLSATDGLHRTDPRLLELLDRLDGHPLSMRLILPLLSTESADEILAQLRGLQPLPAQPLGSESRTTSLAASIEYSLQHLTPQDRRRLMGLSLLHGVADIVLLTAFSDVGECPEPFAGVTLEEWDSLLTRAAEIGLLTALGAYGFRMHPALPGHLAERWQDEDPEGADAQRQAATAALSTAAAQYCRWLVSQIASAEAGIAYYLISRNLRTFAALLDRALSTERWADAQAIGEALVEFLETQGRSEDAEAWVDRVRRAVEGPDGEVPHLDQPAGQLWLYFMGNQANRDMRGHRFDAAESTYRRLLQAQEGQGAGSALLATTYHQLGILSQQTGDLQGAEERYLRSLALDEEGGNRGGAAITYHQLGNLSQDRGDLAAAEAWYSRAINAHEERGDLPSMAGTYHQLGNLAFEGGRLDDAESWYTRSIDIKERIGNRVSAAITYHQLGRLAHLRDRLDEAEDLYTRSLAINEQIGNQPASATTYLQLGHLAHDRGHFDQAEQWYLRSLALNEQLGNQLGMAATSHQLGNLAHHRDDLDQAMEWYLRSLAANEQLGNRRGIAATYNQMAILARRRGDDGEAERWGSRARSAEGELGLGPLPSDADADQHEVLAQGLRELDEAGDVLVPFILGGAVEVPTRLFVEVGRQAPTLGAAIRALTPANSEWAVVEFASDVLGRRIESSTGGQLTIYTTPDEDVISWATTLSAHECFTLLLQARGLAGSVVGTLSGYEGSEWRTHAWPPSALVQPRVRPSSRSILMRRAGSGRASVPFRAGEASPPSGVPPETSIGSRCGRCSTARRRWDRASWLVCCTAS
jgi:tetratricopeptide (TPR) repeat protein